MATVRADNKASFQRSLERRLSGDSNQALRLFARQFFAQVPISELTRKDWATIVGSVESCWQFYQRFDGRRPRVRVFNPNLSDHGYDYHLTVIEVVCSNMRFLRDSIRIRLARRNIALSDIQQNLLSVTRLKGRVVITEDDEPNEELLHLEVSRVTDTRQLEKEIREVIRLVQRVVADFAPMRRQLLYWSDEIGIGNSGTQAHTLRSGEALRVHQTLTWLYSNNFTFLGYEEFLENEQGWQQQPDTCLGLVHKGFYASNQPFDEPAGSLSFDKSPLRSRVHRNAYFDVVSLITTEAGGIRRACRFLGLFTSAVYNQNPADIPFIAKKISHLYARQALQPGTHMARALTRTLEVLPRDELILSDTDELAHTVEQIQALQERRIVRVLPRRDSNGEFINCLVYVPRDSYDTNLRIRIHALLEEQMMAENVEFTTFFSESILVRIYFVLKVDPSTHLEIDVEAIEHRITAMTRSWEDDFHSELFRTRPEDADAVFAELRDVFPPGYQHDYWPVTALDDVDALRMVSEGAPLSVRLYQWMIGGRPETRFKLYHLGTALPLSDVIPILENLGARTVEEHPYELRFGRRRVWIHDFVLEIVAAQDTDVTHLKENFESAFLEIWSGRIENDEFNRLVTWANMDHRSVWVLRAYSRYLGQLQTTFSQSSIAGCLIRYHEITARLIRLFESRSNPRQESSNTIAARLHSEILTAIDQVDNLNDDRVLRKYMEMVLATQRTNYYCTDSEGNHRDYLSFKFLPEMITEMPLPRPKYEIFVYSCRFEGVHLRSGKIARGGIRWSDRVEDYRTEILGLMKAQRVKNAVIVPVGAKGGFLPKRLPVSEGAEAVRAEGVACYRQFVQGLIDLTDNIEEGRVKPPEGVVCHDDEDTYLVLAADKGTATFSDIANEIAEDNGFWLGDAFASGGSVGYDHKAMGITAKGAWRSVQQHFRDAGRNVQEEDFTVIGIGDMAGDVFGNGMLLSHHIKLVAAFNHMHIFLDPEPDPAVSFTERQRLFETPGSTWDDYNRKLISKGGGVFSRNDKSVQLSAEVRRLLRIESTALPPSTLISAILKAPVDLLWSGGIGTYVKSRHESNLDVGDKANDAIRINGSELRCRVVGEGGNLGMTQLGRIEFNLAGGLCFTDSIDNAGGVHCSDTEVNIKILLNQLVESGRLTPARRRRLLHNMTDEVSELVLANNYRQARAINLIQDQTVRRNYEYSRVLSLLTEQGHLDPMLEDLPSDDELQERLAQEKSFTAPELAVLTSYVKGVLKEQLVSCAETEPYMHKEIQHAFPPMLIRKYGGDLKQHRLRPQIIATQIANNMVNNMGMNFPYRIAETTGADMGQIASAYLGARDVFDLEAGFDEVRALDYRVSPRVQKDMMLDLIRLVRRATRWLLRHRRDGLDLVSEVPRFKRALSMLMREWESIVSEEVREECAARQQSLEAMGTGSLLAEIVAVTHYLYPVLSLVDAAESLGQSLRRVAKVYFLLGQELQLNWFSKQMHDFQAGTQWEALAREALQDDLNLQQIAITRSVLQNVSRTMPVERAIARWQQQNTSLLNRWLSMQAEIRSSAARDLSLYTVGIRELADLSGQFR